MRKKVLEREETEEELFNSLTDWDPPPVGIIKKCYCGHKGVLIPHLDGLVCENCGYLIIDQKRVTVSRKRKLKEA